MSDDEKWSAADLPERAALRRLRPEPAEDTWEKVDLRTTIARLEAELAQVRADHDRLYNLVLDHLAHGLASR